MPNFLGVLEKAKPGNPAAMWNCKLCRLLVCIRSFNARVRKKLSIFSVNGILIGTLIHEEINISLTIVSSGTYHWLIKVKMHFYFYLLTTFMTMDVRKPAENITRGMMAT